MSMLQSEMKWWTDHYQALNLRVHLMNSRSHTCMSVRGGGVHAVSLHPSNYGSCTKREWKKKPHQPGPLHLLPPKRPICTPSKFLARSLWPSHEFVANMSRASVRASKCLLLQHQVRSFLASQPTRQTRNSGSSFHLTVPFKESQTQCNTSARKDPCRWQANCLAPACGVPRGDKLRVGAAAK
jgi:hypothetical protein